MCGFQTGRGHMIKSEPFGTQNITSGAAKDHTMNAHTNLLPLRFEISGLSYLTLRKICLIVQHRAVQPT